jgi:hypothetical protein
MMAALIKDPVCVFLLAYLAGVVDLVFQVSRLPRLQGLFERLPALVWAHFIPMLSTSAGLISATRPTPRPLSPSDERQRRSLFSQQERRHEPDQGVKAIGTEARRRRVPRRHLILQDLERTDVVYTALLVEGDDGLGSRHLVPGGVGLVRRAQPAPPLNFEAFSNQRDTVGEGPYWSDQPSLTNSLGGVGP